MGIETTETTYGGGDYRWLASARGTEHPKTGTLDVSSVPISDGVVKSGTPLKYNAGTGLYVACDPTDTALTVAGFVYHDVAAVSTGADQPAGILTDVTINEAYVPGTHDLADGRYICDAQLAGPDNDTIEA